MYRHLPKIFLLDKIENAAGRRLRARLFCAWVTQLSADSQSDHICWNLSKKKKSWLWELILSGSFCSQTPKSAANATKLNVAAGLSAGIWRNTSQTYISVYLSLFSQDVWLLEIWRRIRAIMKLINKYVRRKYETIVVELWEKLKRFSWKDS